MKYPSHVIFFLLVWTGSLFSESVTWVTDHGFRTWSGKNGKTLYAAFISMDKEGAVTLQLDVTDYKEVKVALENLSDADRKYVTGLLAKMEDEAADRESVEKVAAGGLGPGFQEDERLDPALIPRTDLESTENELRNTALALWTGMLWWQRTAFLEIPVTGDSGKKEEWLKEKVAKELRYGKGILRSRTRRKPGCGGKSRTSHQWKAPVGKSDTRGRG